MTVTAVSIERLNARMAAQSEQLLSAISAILIGTDETGRITTWNNEAEAAFSKTAEQMLGKMLAQSGIDWDWECLTKSFTECEKKLVKVRLDDLRYLRADGKEGLLGITINPIKADGPELLGFLMLARDITERKIIERQASHAQKLESIGQLAAGISHEINTPVQYLGDNVRFLQDAFSDLSVLLAAYSELAEAVRTPGDAAAKLAAVDEAVRIADVEYLTEEIPKAIQQSLDGVERVAGIVRAMKEFSHPGGVEKTSADINQALESTITVARNEWKYVSDLVTDLDPHLPPVPCLPGDLNQVFLNIIVNAAHAIGGVVGDGSGAKGQITVSTRHDADSGHVEIRISDTGGGIPKEIRDRVYDPFFTTKEVGVGTGQGLALSHAVIVEKHHGTINFESEEGKGTTFIIRLPLENS